MLNTLSNVQSPMWCPGLRRELSLARNLVAYWPIWEGDGITAMDVVSGRHGTLTNMDPATAWVPGRLGWALELDGSDDYIDCGDINALDGISEMTLAGWLRTSSKPVAYASLISKGPNSNNYWTIRMNANGNVYFHVEEGNVTSAHVEAFAFDDGVWHHYALVFKNSTAYAYIDGILVGDGGAGPAVTDINAASVYIGRHPYVDTSDYKLPGEINCLAAWSRALLPPEIQHFSRDPHALTRPRRLIFSAAAAPPSGGPAPHHTRRRMRGGMVGMGT